MDDQFDEIVDRRGTFCTQWDYIQDRFGERDLLPFSISDTDFKAPEPIREKLEQVVKHGIYGYSRWNHEAFKGTVARYFADRHGAQIGEEWVVYSPSVLYSIAVLLRLLSQENDSVMVFEPMYDAFYHVIRDNRRKLAPMPLTHGDNGYEIDFVRFEELVKDCRVFLLCSPHNPTGRVWTKMEMDRMVELCRSHEVDIISDEIHSDVILTGRRHQTILKYTDDYDGLYLVSSASKTFNTPGLTGSYCVLPGGQVRDAFISRMRNRDFLNSVSLPGMHALMTGYGSCMEYADRLTEYIRGNMKELEEYVNHELVSEGVAFQLPEATYLAWIDMSGVKADSAAIQDVLIHVGKVGIMPGKIYGDENYLRMNLGCPREKLRDGLGRIKKALSVL